MSSQKVSTIERRPNSLRRDWRAPICVLFPAPSMPEKLTIFNPLSLSIFHPRGAEPGAQNPSVSPWRFARSSLSESYDRSDRRAGSQDGSDPNDNQPHSTLLGGSNCDTCRLRCSNAARLGRFCGCCSNRFLGGGLRRLNSL